MMLDRSYTSSQRKQVGFLTLRIPAFHVRVTGWQDSLAGASSL